MGRRAHRPDHVQRRQVEAMAAYGILSSTSPARSASTRRRCESTTATNWTRHDQGQCPGGGLFNSAKNGNVTAQIFWLKTRARWRETPVELQHSGSIGRKDLCEFSDAELIAIIGSAVDVPATLKAHGSERTEPNARGFLDLVANGQYRPKV